jgi:low affinity Fe/Cu permease
MHKELSVWSHTVAQKLGTPLVFFLVVGASLVWVSYGLLHGYSERWHLVMDIPATLLPFVMLFLLQTSQNRDTRAIQTKLDELLLATQDADDNVVDLEDRPESWMEDKRRQQQTRSSSLS